METKKEALPLVLAPLSETEFFDEYWEQAPLHIDRSDAGHFKDLISLEALELLLSTSSLQYPAVQLTQSGHSIDVSDYTDGLNKVLPLRLIEGHANGATIVISQAHDKFPALAEFRRNVHQQFKLRCQTNLYLSPPNQKGFNAHYDSHDVFILQVHGCKTFNFYEGGVELPFQHDSFDADQHPAGALTQSITLNPGDTLYIPRGVMHDAVATNDTASLDSESSNNAVTNPAHSSSLHITLGVYPITQRDLLLEAIEHLTLENPSYRESIPRQWLTPDTVYSSGEHDNSPSIPTVELNKDLVARALSSIQDRAAIDSTPNCMGRLSVLNSSPLSYTDDKSQDSFLENKHFESFHLQQNRLLSVEKDAVQVRLRTHGSVLEFSGASKAIVELLLQNRVTTSADLKSFPQSDLQLVLEKLDTVNLLEMNDS